MSNTKTEEALLGLLKLLHRETVNRPVDYRSRPLPWTSCIICGERARDGEKLKHRTECPWSLLPAGLLEDK